MTNYKSHIKKSYIILTIIFLTALSAYALETFQFLATTNNDLESKMEFLDKLSICEKYKYHTDGTGIYQIFGKLNNACKVKWTIVDCNFPEGVYQEFSKVQKRKTLDRYNRFQEGKTMEIKDKDYRYLLYTGNKYCQNNFMYY